MPEVTSLPPRVRPHRPAWYAQKKTPRPPLGGRGVIPIILLGCRGSGGRFLFLLAVLLLGGGLGRIRGRRGGGRSIGSHRRSSLRHIGGHCGGGDAERQQR